MMTLIFSMFFFMLLLLLIVVHAFIDAFNLVQYNNCLPQNRVFACVLLFLFDAPISEVWNCVCEAFVRFASNDSEQTNSKISLVNFFVQSHYCSCCVRNILLAKKKLHLIICANNNFNEIKKKNRKKQSHTAVLVH